MLATALIVFREVFEAALILGIVLAATRGIQGRNLWVSAGLLAGLLGAILVAIFAGAISAAAKGLGQEIFNATVLFTAVLMLAWHQIWMSQQGSIMAKEFNALGKSIKEGGKPLYLLAIVVGVAIMREGSEAVLFLYGVTAGSTDSKLQLLTGGLLGFLAGGVCGAGLYFGLMKIPTKKLFFVTGWMIMLLAAGMASQGAAFLVQADILPALIDQVWNTSAILERKSILGQVLHTLVGYDDRPAGIQILFYVMTLVGIYVLSKTVAKSFQSAQIPVNSISTTVRNATTCL